MNTSAAHTALKTAILTALGSLPDVRLFSNAVGHARDPSTGAHLNYGLCVGSADLIGLVFPRGRFLALEVKTGRATLSPEQAAFLRMVNKLGGVGREVRSVNDAIAALSEARQP